jgi:putative transposase
MDDFNILQSLGQVSFEKTAEVFRVHLRGAVGELICDVMAEEVTELCGSNLNTHQGIFLRGV